MKIKFDAQLPHQREAIAAVVNLFEGQQSCRSQFSVVGASHEASEQLASLFSTSSFGDTGVGNQLFLSHDEILNNTQQVQLKNGLEQSDSLAELDFTIEMETGTGKTYVYLSSAFELHQRYGFTKFIIVVPSVAIREGVAKSLQMTQEHFKTHYGEQADWFVYDSSKPTKVRDFAANDGISIMVINIDAFKEKTTKKEGSVGQVRMHSARDDLNGVKPIDLIKETCPVVFIDEPQSVLRTAKDQQAISELNPLFKVRYSATHVDKVNMLYKLDSVQAYEQKLVKQIEIASLKVTGDHNHAYLKLLSVQASPRQAKVEVDFMRKGKITRKTMTIKPNQDLYLDVTKNPHYEGFDVNDIYTERGGEYINFHTNTTVLRLGETMGGVDELLLKRMQIRKTIEEHLDKELKLAPQGIKVLSLFFIDRVANYRVYDRDNNRTNGIYADYFEQELSAALSKNPKYRKIYPAIYLDDGQINAVALAELVANVHNGYFAADRKKNAAGKMVEVYKDSKGAAGEAAKSTADIDAYKLIMTEKEQLLDLKQDLRFIFSHSALKEGWDNPNVFQICTLNETVSAQKKRQEIGRGLRICVNQEGERVHGFEVNTLTVMANESYEDFAASLQQEIEQEEGIRFGLVEAHLFANINVAPLGKQTQFLGAAQSKLIFVHLQQQGYLSPLGLAQNKLKLAISEGDLLLPEPFNPLKQAIIDKLKQVVGRHLNIKSANARKAVTLRKEVLLNEDFNLLWDKIKHHTTYRLKFDESALIERCAGEIKDSLVCGFSRLEYSKAIAAIERSGVNPTDERVATQVLSGRDFPLPDIVSYLQQETQLTRRAVIEILQRCDKLSHFSKNPQQFIEQACHIINSQKNLSIIDGISYHKVGADAFFSSACFSDEALFGYMDKNMLEAKKSLHDHVIYDSDVEHQFALSLEQRTEVKLYCKLPAWFKINTPLGGYNPDWAILLEQHGEPTLYFVVETKSHMISSDLREAESKKIACGIKHFEAIGDQAKFFKATDYDSFIDQI